MIDFVDIVFRESGRFREVAGKGDFIATVPSCPEWNLSDLVWHLTEVQDFWGRIVDGLVVDPETMDDLERPDDGELIALFDDRSALLVRALGERNATDECWSWHGDGHSVGWARRRQAHEALIHRVDAELTVSTTSEINAELAEDGVDEILSNMIDGPVPEWGEVVHDGVLGTLRSEGSGREWGMRFGRFQGTSPESGTTYDRVTIDVIEPPSNPEVVISGAAIDLDLWLWGRGDPKGLAVEGDSALLDRVRAIAAESTQ